VGDLSITDISKLSFGAVPVGPGWARGGGGAPIVGNDVEQEGRAGRFGTMEAAQDAALL
jgi:hypothetical protein